MAPFQQVSEHISVMGVDDIKSLESLLQTHWSTIQDIDRLTKRIFNGRKWFLENHSDILICASVHYKQQLTSLVNFHQLRNSLESKPSLSVLKKRHFILNDRLYFNFLTVQITIHMVNSSNFLLFLSL